MCLRFDSRQHEDGLSSMNTSPPATALVPVSGRVQLDSRADSDSVRSAQKHWQPPEGLSPAEVQAVIDAATSERDRLLLRVLWATGARISEVLALRSMDVQRDHLVLANRKNPSQPIKRVFLPAGQADLPGALLIWAKEYGVTSRAPLFFSRKRGPDVEWQAIGLVQAWTIVKAASEQAGIQVLALRASQHGGVGE